MTAPLTPVQANSIAAIKRAAAKYKVDWRPIAAIDYHESGLNHRAVGDKGTSFGLDQEHVGGALPTGLTSAQIFDIDRQAEFQARHVAALNIQHLKPFQQTYQISKGYERPANVKGETVGANNWLRTVLPTLGGSTPPTRTPAPKPALGAPAPAPAPAAPLEPLGYSVSDLSALQGNLNLGQQAASRAQSALGAISGRVQSTATPLDLSAFLDIAQPQEPVQAPVPTRTQAAVVPPKGAPATVPGAHPALEPSHGAYASPLGNPKFVRLGMPYQGTHGKAMNAKSGSDNWESENAVDMGTPVGTPVYATQSGTIGNAIGSLGSGGRFAGLRLHLNTAGNEFYYAHLSKLAVKAGQKVQRGQLLGYSGEANGTPHLHIAAKKGNPAKDFGY